MVFTDLVGLDGAGEPARPRCLGKLPVAMYSVPVRGTYRIAPGIDVGEAFELAGGDLAIEASCPACAAPAYRV